MFIDFSDPVEVGVWTAINDAVMGGVSSSQLCYDPSGHAVFTGHVSLENNGGFASVRCLSRDLGRRNVTGFILEVLGDGKRYKLNLRTDNGFEGVNYQARFEPPKGIWTICRLARADFLPTWRGRPVPDAPLFDPARLRQIGLMIADRQSGVFSLAIRNISVEQQDQA